MTSDIGPRIPLAREDPSSGLAYRIRLSETPGTPSFILLHGFGGDEGVLWVIESALPTGGLIASPRGLFAAEGGGYAWVSDNLGPGESLHDFNGARRVLVEWTEALQRSPGLDMDNTYLVGFSQGSALAFALTALGDLRPRGLIALAAYLPQGDLAGLAGTPVFWSHGTRDDRVPVERARRDVKRLQSAGALVDYCETDTGHKVGIECIRALKAWLLPASESNRSA
jgi:phospholipase/carboxylesterase